MKPNIAFLAVAAALALASCRDPNQPMDSVRKSPPPADAPPMPEDALCANYDQAVARGEMRAEAGFESICHPRGRGPGVL